MRTELTLKAQILLFICGFIPYFRKHKKRKSFQWPIEKVIWILKTLPVDLIAAKFQRQLFGKDLYTERQMYLKVYIFIMQNQLRGYTRLAKNKGWIKNQ